MAARVGNAGMSFSESAEGIFGGLSLIAGKQFAVLRQIVPEIVKLLLTKLQFIFPLRPYILAWLKEAGGS